jgi:chemotaxis protein CheX
MPGDHGAIGAQEESVSVSESAMEIIEHAELLDRAADEVFSTTMGLVCVPSEEPPQQRRLSISAILGFAGALSGCFVLFAPDTTALTIAERLTGIPCESLDEMVRDAFGEICNLLTGSWKGGHPGLSSACQLSTPTIVTGAGYSLFGQRGSIELVRHYRFEDFGFTVTILVEAEHHLRP